ncbi:MAG TPA: DUF177 domain-containing protein [Devosia sp.]|nr:DUF177 domain-containing protein [Devosia sp.]
MSGTHERWRLKDASIRIDSMPVDGRDVRLVADEEDRAQLAAQLDLTSIKRLEVALHAVKFRGGIRVTGRLDAAVEQPSVVSFVPVRQVISEPIDRVFLPGGEKLYAGEAGAEIFVDLDGDDVPDHFEGNEADLTDLVVETLSLAIDPYPRAEGESLEDLGIAGAADDAPESPFAALRRLKSGSDETS